MKGKRITSINLSALFILIISFLFLISNVKAEDLICTYEAYGETISLNITSRLRDGMQKVKMYL